MTTRIHKADRPDRPAQSLSQLWQVPVFIVGVVALVLVAASSPWRKDPNLWQLEKDLIRLRTGLSNTVEPLDTLLALSDNVLAHIDRFPRHAGECHYLVGRLCLKKAEELGRLESADALQIRARGHFDKALALEVPEADKMPLMYRLGVLVYQEGQELPRAVELLRASIEQGAESPIQAYEMLADACLRLPTPDLAGALFANQKQLEHLGDDELGIAQARLKRGEILIRGEKWMEALKTLERIGASAPSHLRLKARFLQTRCCEVEGLWRKAIPLWKELLEDPRVVTGGKGHIYYALGMCYASAEVSEPETALTCWKEAQKQGGPEGQAAGIRMGETQLMSDVHVALENWSRALARVKTPADYQNPYVTLHQLRELFHESCRQFLDRQEYLYAQETAELFKRVGQPGQADVYLGNAAEALALDLRDRLGDKEEVRAQFRKAGQAFAAAAAPLPPDKQADLLWRGGMTFLPARDYPHAAQVLEKFVRVEKNEPRLAEGWLALAETRLALKDMERAREAFYKCIEFPNTPFAYRARYQLAQGELARKNVKQAIDILEQNLKFQGPGVDRDAHEKSLYLLATVLCQEKEYGKAVVRLKEAIRLNPKNDSVLNIYDYLGDCYRKLAAQAGKKLVENVSPEVRAHYERERIGFLQQAADTYLELADLLEMRGKTGPLPAPELLLLRKSLFGAADIYFEMNHIPEALRRYQILQARYRKQVEGLIACQRIWQCVGRVLEPPDRVQQVQGIARAAAKLAQEDLAAMDENSPPFQGPPGVWRKSEWNTWLNWVQRQLAPPSPPMPQAKLIPTTGS